MKSAFSIALAASLFLTTLSLVSTPLLLTVKWTGSLGELASSSTSCVNRGEMPAVSYF